MQASFDEFNPDIRASYAGTPLTFPEQRRSEQEIIDAQDGLSRLAGFMLCHNADRIRAETRGGQALIWFHFEH